ncbi:MAG: hypothetical protein J6U65_04910 [Bacteroidaceae bacterium]|nr:hypothetical protein [Bacteroidaceae bacterium]
MIRLNNWGEIDIKLAIDTLVEMFSCKSPSLLHHSFITATKLPSELPFKPQKKYE